MRLVYCPSILICAETIDWIQRSIRTHSTATDVVAAVQDVKGLRVQLTFLTSVKTPSYGGRINTNRRL